MIATHMTSIAAFLTFLPDTILSQEANYYWSDEVATTTITSFPREAPATDAAVRDRPFVFSAFDATLTPVFIVNSEVCNYPNVVVFPLQTTGPEINFTIRKVENGMNAMFMIDEKQRLVLKEKVKFFETQIHVSASNTEASAASERDSVLSAIFPSPSSITVQHENFLVIKVMISDSFCPGSQSSTTTIVIVSLSVLCIVFLAAFSLSLIALRRSRPSLFNSAHGVNGKSNQVGPGPSQLNNQNAQSGGPLETDAVKCSPCVNLKPTKSSLKVSKRIPEVPQFSITCDSPDSPLPLRVLSDSGIREEDQEQGETVAADDSSPVIAMNGFSSPKLSVADSPEKRRPSAVTFNETTQIIQIARKKK